MPGHKERARAAEGVVANSCFRRRSTRRTPQALYLHRFDHRYAIHRLLRFSEDRDCRFDLAHLLVCRLRFLGGGLRSCRILLIGFGCVGLS